MRALCAAVLSVSVVAFAGTARAEDDNAKKIVGVWELTKAGGELPKGSTVEFAKGDKLTVVAKIENSEMKLAGTYKLAKDKLTVKLKIGEMDVEHTVTIKKLTDDTLEIEDEDKKVDVFTKKKK
jgi:uncharacterized protein (TIGR03066 family)